MTFQTPTIDWFYLIPVIVILAVAIIGVFIEAFVPVAARRTTHLVVAMLGLAGAFAGVVAAWLKLDGNTGAANVGVSALSTGSYLADRFTLFAQGTLIILSFIAVLVMAERTTQGEDAFTPAASSVPGSDYEEAARRAGLVQTEVFPLTMLSLTGMLVFPASGDLVTMFVALEVLSLPLYLMCGIARRRRLLSQEASLKYFLLGAFASAIFLFGVALLYGYSGSLSLAGVHEAVVANNGPAGLLMAGIALLLVGLLFKVGAVPFHSWMPDVYQGAPTPVTGFMAACTKVAAFGALIRIIAVVMAPLDWDWRPVLWGVAVLTMVIGSIVALTQTDIKRMVAYSSIAHAGFILVGTTAVGVEATTWTDGVSSSLFYLLAYGFATIGAFTVIFLVRERDEHGSVTAEATSLDQWAGLGKRSPFMAVSFVIFLLSFAGIPLTSGFVGKFAVFTASVGAGGVWPVVIGVIASAIAAFFYVRIIVLMFFTKAPDDSVTVSSSTGPAAFVVGATAVLTVILGIIPGPVLSLAEEAMRMLL